MNLLLMIGIVKSMNRDFSRQHQHCVLRAPTSHCLSQILYHQLLLPGGVDVGDGLGMQGMAEGSF
jgi:hypothetical protein